MADRLYPLERKVFDRVVLPFIAGHRKKAGRPPSVGHDEFFAVLSLFYGRESPGAISRELTETGTRFTPATSAGAKVAFSGSC